MKILVSPAHYALGPKLQSEFYLAHKVLEGLAQSNSELDLHILCCHYYEKNSLPKNCHIYEMIPGDNNPEITTPTRIRFYLWIFIKSSLQEKSNRLALAFFT